MLQIDGLDARETDALALFLKQREERVWNLFTVGIFEEINKQNIFLLLCVGAIVCWFCVTCSKINETKTSYKRRFIYFFKKCIRHVSYCLIWNTVRRLLVVTINRVYIMRPGCEKVCQISLLYCFRCSCLIYKLNYIFCFRCLEKK